MKVAIVSGLCVPYDAVSDAVRHQRAALVEAGHEVMVFAHSGSALAPSEVVETADPWWMHHHPAYRDADLVILHHGIHYELFNALVLDHDRAVMVVHFHNITPPELLTGETRRAAEAGFDQLALAGRAHSAWCDSAHNVEVLCAHADVDPRDVIVLPLCVPHAELGGAASPSGRRGVLAVGRLVEAKGLEVLVRAYALLPAELRPAHPLRIIGRRSSLEAGFPERLLELAESLGIGAHVDVDEDADHDRLAAAYASAEVFVSASRHEGFCVPVIEALGGGCAVVVTDAGALPDTVGDFGSVVPVGDPAALARAVVDALDARSDDRGAELERYLEQFRPSGWASRLTSEAEAAVSRGTSETLAERVTRQHSSSAGVAAAGG